MVLLKKNVAYCYLFCTLKLANNVFPYFSVYLFSLCNKNVKN